MKSTESTPRSYLRCPECGSAFPGDVNDRWPVARKEQVLRCVKHGHRFRVQGAVADLLPPRYAEVLERLATGSRTNKPRDIVSAAEWLGDALAIEPPLPQPGRDRTLAQLLGRVGSLIHLGRSMGLTENDLREIYSIVAAEAMASGYLKHVADPAEASLEAVNYEKYEDILLRKVVQSALDASASVGLVELGSGPGRLLHQYGSTIASKPGAAEVYRRLGPQLYRPESLLHHERLRLLLGVDFSQDMLLSASRWLARDGLGELIEQGHITQVRATVRELPIDFALPEWNATTRIACILFQTLGNQLSRALQVDMLKSARRVAGDDGVVFVSVFNAASFHEQGAPYYESIEGSVGRAWGFGDRAFVSNRGVYSRWLYPDELKSLMNDAGMPSADVLDGAGLASFPDFEQYIDLASQDRYKRRALVALYAPSLDVRLT